jgi:dolichyl-phosphate-mannose-protein mannosyltransferase
VQNKLANFLFISAFFILVFVFLFLLRGVDDNSLFSWSWAFAKVDAAAIYLFLITGLALSFVLARIAIPDTCHVPLLAALSFGACLPFWSEPEIIVDASRYFTQAKHLEIYGITYFVKEWGRAIQVWTDLPLVPFLYGLIFKLFGESRAAIQLFTTTLFSLTVVLTYLTGKALWNRETGFAAGLLLLGIPYLLTQVPLMLVDVPTMFFFMLAVFTFLEALNKGGCARSSFSVGSITLAALSKYSAWPMLSVLGVALAVFAAGPAESKDRRALFRGAAILLVSLMLMGAVLLLNYDVVSRQFHLLREYQQPGLSRWGESLVSTFLFQVHPVITLSVLASAVIAVRKRDARFAIVSWLLLLVLLFGIRRIRYTLPLFPMVTLMAGNGLQAVKREEMKRFLLYGTVAASLVTGVFAYLPLAQGMSAANLKRAGEYLNTLDAPAIEVITLPPRDPVANPAVGVPLLDLFTDKRIGYQYRLEGSPGREEIERSSLRFTWEYRNPAYYSEAPRPLADPPVVVISDASNGPLPGPVAKKLGGRRLSKAFTTDDTIFRYTVGVRIYQ